MGFADFLKLMRVAQWYKNLVIFLPLIFFGHFFDASLLFNVFIGFLSLCFISSVNYIVNDIVDMKRDRHHPEKMGRPLASGSVKVGQALFLIILLAAFSIALALLLPIYFLISVIALFVSTQLYSLFFKNEVFLDIIFIAANFVIRAISGAFIVNTYVSVWLIFCTFFLSLFLSAGKRYADFIFLGDNAENHRKTLKHYTKEVTTSLMVITTSLLIFSYAIYTFFSNYKNMAVTLPVALYVIFRYFFLVYTGSEISRHPERVYKDRKLVFGVLVWLAAVFLIIYMNPYFP